MEKIREAFNAYFKRFGLELPEQLEPKGRLSGGGWSVTYVLTTDEAGEPCLDFLAEHRMTNMRHVRIRQNGEVIALESIEESFSYDAEVEGDKERAEKAFHEHNNRVADLLREKGLI
jgi:hypothetical protein